MIKAEGLTFTSGSGMSLALWRQKGLLGGELVKYRSAVIVERLFTRSRVELKRIENDSQHHTRINHVSDVEYSYEYAFRL